jgi:hypothetical protein
MKIEIICQAYNEEFLMPFFLKYYSYIDKINILLDIGTNDKTEEIIKQYKNTKIIKVKSPNMMDEVWKKNNLNMLYKTIKDGWVLICDIDEFVGNNLKEINETNDLYKTQFYNVYRNINDSDLDINKEVFSQRLCGDKDWKDESNNPYHKPNFIKANKNITWEVGFHNINSQGLKQGKDLYGTHWANADLCFCIDRQIKNRRDRQPEINKVRGHDFHYWNLTEKAIIDKCKKHENDQNILEFINK